MRHLAIKLVDQLLADASIDTKGVDAIKRDLCYERANQLAERLILQAQHDLIDEFQQLIRDKEASLPPPTLPVITRDNPGVGSSTQRSSSRRTHRRTASRPQQSGETHVKVTLDLTTEEARQLASQYPSSHPIVRALHEAITHEEERMTDIAALTRMMDAASDGREKHTFAKLIERRGGPKSRICRCGTKISEAAEGFAVGECNECYARGYGK